MNTQQRVTLVLNGASQGKDRARFNGKTGHAYTPRATVLAENRVVVAWENAGSPWLGEGPLRASIVIVVGRPQAHWTTKGKLSATGRRSEWPLRKPDVDNAQKLLFDPLNKRAYRDDVQIVNCHVVRKWARRDEGDHTTVTFEQIRPAIG